MHARSHMCVRTHTRMHTYAHIWVRFQNFGTNANFRYGLDFAGELGVSKRNRPLQLPVGG